MRRRTVLLHSRLHVFLASLAVTLWLTAVSAPMPVAGRTTTADDKNIQTTVDPDALVILPLDEGVGTTAGDSSGLGNDGTLVGALFEANTADGSPFAVRFDGIDDYIDLGVIDVAGSGLTLAAWFNATSFPGGSNDPRIISKASGTSANDHVFMLSTVKTASDTRLRARIRVAGSTTTVIASSGNLVTDQWYHAAVTYDGLMVRLYLDAVEVGATPLSGAVDIAPAIPVAVGSQPVGALSRHFDGLIDDARILQRGMSQAELMAIFIGTTAPMAFGDAYATPEDTALVVDAINGVLANDIDPDFDTLYAVLDSDVSDGVLNLNLDGSFDYTPDANFFGVDSFTYHATDSIENSDPVAVILTVDPVNDVPIAVDDTYGTAPNMPLLSVNASEGVLSNDSDTDLDSLFVALVSDVSDGSLVLNPDGSFDYTADTLFTGIDTFTYEVNDLAATDTAMVTIVVEYPPFPLNDAYSTAEDTALVVPDSLGVLANDFDVIPPNDLTAAVVTPPIHGTLTVFSAGGGFTYDPEADYSGTDLFTYEAIDGTTGIASTATVILTVDPVNDAPVATPDMYSAAPATVLFVGAVNGVLANDQDVDLDVLQAVLVDDASNGVLGLNGDGSFSYTSAPGFDGIETFTYVAADMSLQSDTTTVRIRIRNAAPYIETGTPLFTKQVIANDVGDVHFALGADFDGDNDIDILATDFTDDMLLWYERDSLGVYVPHVLDPNLSGAYPAHVADVDLDGDMDALACGYDANVVAWYENDGTGGFTRRDVDTNAVGAHSVVTLDMDKDGDTDLLAAIEIAGTINWYENDGSLNFTVHVIDTTAIGAKRAEFGDFDGDGDIDVVSASYLANEVAWYENDGSFGFTKRLMDAGIMGAYSVAPADTDGDGDLDVFAAGREDDTIVLYVNDGAGSFSKVVIDSKAEGARAVHAVDFDRDGRVDVLVASVDDDTIALCRNLGNNRFSQEIVDNTADGAYGVSAVDLDRDGDLDVLACSRDDDTVAAHYQKQAHFAAIAGSGGSLTIGPTRLRTVNEDGDASGLTYSVTAAPASGELRLVGVPLSVNDTFTQQDINSFRVTYVHDGSVSLFDGFEFEVTDGGGSGNDPARGAFTINITDALAAHWPLDENFGSVAHDIAGTNDGFITGSAVWQPQSGRDDGALAFDGIDDFINVGGVDVDPGNGLTIAMWVRPGVFTTDSRFISKTTGPLDQDHYWAVGLFSESGVFFRVKAGTVTSTIFTLQNLFGIGDWYHLACVYDESQMRVYGNGQLIASLPKTGSVDMNPAVITAIGDQPPNTGVRRYTGWLDDVRLYSRPLSPFEIGLLATPSTNKPAGEPDIMEPIAGSVPKRYALHRNAPNPFNPSTTIRYELPHTAHVSLEIFDVRGRRIRTLVNRQQTVGRKSVEWDARDDRGTRVASGVYFLRLRSADFVRAIKITLVE